MQHKAFLLELVVLFDGIFLVVNVAVAHGGRWCWIASLVHVSIVRGYVSILFVFDIVLLLIVRIGNYRFEVDPQRLHERDACVGEYEARLRRAGAYALGQGD